MSVSVNHINLPDDTTVMCPHCDGEIRLLDLAEEAFEVGFALAMIRVQTRKEAEARKQNGD